MRRVSSFVVFMLLAAILLPTSASAAFEAPDLDGNGKVDIADTVKFFNSSGIDKDLNGDGTFDRNDLNVSLKQIDPQNVAVSAVGAVAGYVKNGDGLPVPQAWVQNGVSQSVYTDGNGYYRFDSFPRAARASVTVTSDIYGSFVSSPFPVYPGQLNPVPDVVMTLGAASLTGTVYHGSVPLAGVAVEIKNIDYHQFAETDSSGRYTMSGIPAGSYDVYYMLDGYQTVADRLDISGNGAITKSVELLPVTTATVSGYVYTGLTDFTPVPYAVITIGTRTFTADANGQFYVTDVEPGTYDVSFSADGYLSAELGQVTFGAGQYYGFQISLGSSAVSLGSLKGVVKGYLSGNYVPLAEATVKLTMGEAVYTVQTDSAGQFELNGLPYGTYDLLVQMAGYNDQSSQVIVSANSLDLGNLFLDAYATVTGYVYQGTEALADVLVSLYKDGIHYGNALTDSNGGFTISDVLPGSGYQLQIQKTGLAPLTLNGITLQNGENAIPGYELLPEIATATLTGIVTNALGEPVEGIRVNVAGLEVITGIDGKYEVTGLVPGTYELAAYDSHEHYYSTDVSVSLGAGLIVQPISVFDSMLTLHVGDLNGADLSGARVTLKLENGIEHTYSMNSPYVTVYDIPNGSTFDLKVAYDGKTDYVHDHIYMGYEKAEDVMLSAAGEAAGRLVAMAQDGSYIDSDGNAKYDLISGLIHSAGVGEEFAEGSGDADDLMNTLKMLNAHGTSISASVLEEAVFGAQMYSQANALTGNIKLGLDNGQKFDIGQLDSTAFDVVVPYSSILSAIPDIMDNGTDNYAELQYSIAFLNGLLGTGGILIHYHPTGTNDLKINGTAVPGFYKWVPVIPLL